MTKNQTVAEQMQNLTIADLLTIVGCTDIRIDENWIRYQAALVELRRKGWM